MCEDIPVFSDISPSALITKIGRFEILTLRYADSMSRNGIIVTENLCNEDVIHPYAGGHRLFRLNYIYKGRTIYLLNIIIC